MDGWGVQRQTIVAELGLDTPDQLPVFDRIVASCAALLRTPHAAFAVMTEDGPFLKSTYGLDVRYLQQRPSFCERARDCRDAFVVPDARHDPRFCNEPLVMESPSVRFYAGTSVRAPNGEVIGTLCAMAPNPRICMRTELDAFLNLRDVLEQVLVLQQAASTDPLTGTPRRRYFGERLIEACRSAARRSQPLSLLLVDLDHLDRYVHTYGQHEGDRIVAQVADLIEGELKRPGDLLARLAAAQFGILLPYTNPIQAQQFGEKLLGKINKAGFLHETAPYGLLTASLGGAFLQLQGQTPDLAQQLMHRALNELAQQKAAGGNGIRFCDWELLGEEAANTEPGHSHCAESELCSLSNGTARPGSSA